MSEQKPHRIPFVILGQHFWGLEPGNAINIAWTLSQSNPVLYVNVPPDFASLLRIKKSKKANLKFGFILRKKQRLIKENDNLFVYYPNLILLSINWITSHFIFKKLNKTNNNLVAGNLKRILKKIHFDDYIIINDNEIFRYYYLKELLKPRAYVYYMRDFFTEVPYWSRHGKKMEPELLGKSDLVITNSMFYKEYAKKINNNTFYIGQGCEFVENRKEFDASEPEDLKSIKRPRIGYIGAVTTIKLNLELIRKMSAYKPEWNYVFVGNEDKIFAESDLHNVSNVYFLGPRPYADLPKYISNFDVCINPQVLNKITEGNYPLKIDEYLAFGKPVVAFNTPAMKLFRQVVYLANDHNEFIHLIEKALAENNEIRKTERLQLVKDHTWNNSVKELMKALDTILK